MSGISRPLKTWQWMSTSSVDASGAWLPSSRLAASRVRPARRPRFARPGRLATRLAAFRRPPLPLVPDFRPSALLPFMAGPPHAWRLHPRLARVCEKKRRFGLFRTPAQAGTAGGIQHDQLGRLAEVAPGDELARRALQQRT